MGVNAVSTGEKRAPNVGGALISLSGSTGAPLAAPSSRLFLSSCSFPLAVATATRRRRRRRTRDRKGGGGGEGSNIDNGHRGSRTRGSMRRKKKDRPRVE